MIAYGAGGALETVVVSEDPTVRTGVFFDEQTVAALKIAVQSFDQLGEFSPYACRANAEKFSQQNFLETFSQMVNLIIKNK